MSESTTNLLLSVFPEQGSDSFLSHCVDVPLPVRTSLHKAGEPSVFAYFITSGLASVTAMSKDGGSLEVEIIGREGLVGSIQLLGPASVGTDAYMQMAGTGLRVPMVELRKLFRSSEEVRDCILEFVQVQILTMSQLVGCNRLHEAEARLARWLLMAQDRTGLRELLFTQEFLAIMLGSQRTTVTLVAGNLQRLGCIEYARGRVTVLDREKLEEAACDCYQIAKQLYGNLYSTRRPAV